MLNLLRRCALAAICSGIATPALSQVPAISFPPGGGTAAPSAGTLNTSCDSTQGTGCGGRETINHLEICFDGDEDGVCDGNDECLDTPAGTPVFFNGCHLQTGKAMVLNGVNFEFDRAELTISSLPVLERAVEVLQGQSEVLVTVDGHTDNLGSDAYNEKLSWQRVRSVYTYFVNQGIDPARLAYRGFGESRPILPNQNPDGSDNPAGRAANRRVELNVLDPIVFHTMKENNDDRFSNIEPGTPQTFIPPSPASEPEPAPEPASEPEIVQDVPEEPLADVEYASETEPANTDVADEDPYTAFDAATETAVVDDVYGESGTESAAAEPVQKTEPAPAAPEETTKAPDAATEPASAEGSAAGDDYLDEFDDYGEAAEPAAEAEAEDGGADDEAAESSDTEDASGVEEDYEVYEYEY